MKHALLFALVLVVPTACREQTAPPADLLYRSWLLTALSYDGQPQEPNHYARLVTFPRNGNFRDGQPDDSRWCCSPGSFVATRTTLRFVWDTSNPICARINCLLSPLAGGVRWQIETLTNTSLVLTNDRQTLTFTGVY